MGITILPIDGEKELFDFTKRTGIKDLVDRIVCAYKFKMKQEERIR